MKKLLYTICFSLFSLSAYNQVGTDFWIAPPDVSDRHNPPGGEPIYLLIQSQSNMNGTVTISQPANPSFTPIVITLNAGENRKVDLSLFKASLETRPTNIILNTGLRITSAEQVSVQYEVVNSSNADFTSLKGTNALGNYFYIPFHKHAPFSNHTFSFPDQAYASFDIVATDNNTIVRIYPNVSVDGHSALQQFSIILNAGQTYSCGYTGANYEQPSTHPSGAVIWSDKPIAVTLKDDSQHNPSAACYDLQFEQIVPVNKVGTDYIAVKGLLDNTGDESLVLMATQNGTDIYIDGASIPVTTLFAGEYYRIDMDYLNLIPNNSIYVRASSPVYVMHFSGFGCEMGDALIPSINNGLSTINIARFDAENFYLNLVVRTTHINNFTITGSGTATIDPASFVAVPGTSGQFSAARLQYNPTQIPVNASFTIQNSTGAFQAAVLLGGPNSNARYTYLSSFGGLNTLPLRLLRLTGRTQADGNYLEWIAGEDGEQYRYELQIQQGSEWITLDIRESGNLSTNRKYQYTHSLQTGGLRLYRIAATELSVSKTIYSNTVMLDRGNTGRNTMNVYPNPTKEQVNIQLSGTDGTVTAGIYTINGQLVQQANNTGNSFTMDIRNLPAGIYILKVEDARSLWQEKITKL